MRRLFLTSDHRLNLFWRLLTYTLCYIRLIFVAMALQELAFRIPRSNPLGTFIYAALAVAGTYSLTRFYRTHADKRPWNGMALPSLRGHAAQFLLGLAAGVALFGRRGAAPLVLHPDHGRLLRPAPHQRVGPPILLFLPSAIIISAGARHYPLIAVKMTGPIWLVGPPGMPEEGLVGILAELLGVALLLAWLHWRQRRIDWRAILGAEGQPVPAEELFASMANKTG